MPTDNSASSRRKTLFVVIVTVVLALIGAGMGIGFGILAKSLIAWNEYATTTPAATAEATVAANPAASAAATQSSTMTTTPLMTTTPEHVGGCASTKRSVKSSPNGKVLVDDQYFGGSWIVFQRRLTGDVDFYRNWANYTQGFGDVTGDYWMGLERIHRLCNNVTKCELLVRVQYAGEPYKSYITQRADGCYWARYSSFWLGGAPDNYRLGVSGFSGPAGDDLSWSNNNQQFSTWDRDHDSELRNCAKLRHGAWWYRVCGRSLNGGWGRTYRYGVVWFHVTGVRSAAFTEMAARRRT